MSSWAGRGAGDSPVEPKARTNKSWRHATSLGKAGKDQGLYGLVRAAAGIVDCGRYDEGHENGQHERATMIQGQRKLRLLDLFCGAGGCSVGYHRAGFDVVGVDNRPQPHYPFEFHQADALEYCAEHWQEFDAIHASPPCQDHSLLRNSAGLHGTGWLLMATLHLLEMIGRPFVVENVVGARLPAPVMLCGANFGLGASGMDLPRHRLFQCSFGVIVPACSHRRGKAMGVYGNGTNQWHRKKLGRNLSIAEMRQAMGIGWMTQAELSQAIPPAYTEWIGGRLLEYLAMVQEVGINEVCDSADRGVDRGDRAAGASVGGEGVGGLGG